MPKQGSSGFLFPDLVKDDTITESKPPKPSSKKQPPPIGNTGPAIFYRGRWPVYKETLSRIGPIYYYVFPNTRRIILRIDREGCVRVSIPPDQSIAVAKQFLRSKKEWILQNLAFGQKFKPSTAPPEIPGETLQQACQRIAERLKDLAARHGLTFSAVKFRRQKTRWGSCNTCNALSLNISIALLPSDLADYILLHELVHTRFKDHGKAFWTELVRLMPDARDRAKRLRKHKPA